MRVQTLFVAALALLFTGCDSKPQQNANSGASETAAPAKPLEPTAADRESVARKVRETTGEERAGAPARESAPPGRASDPPAGAHPTSSSPPDSARPPAAAPSSLRFDAPESWRRRPPGSAARAYEYELPATDGGEAGELAVFYFGAGQGGSVESNLNRWRGQFKGADGQPVSPESASRETFKVGEWNVTVIEVAGEYLGMTMPGGPAPTPKPNQRMIAAVIEAGGATWFVKATGPDATIAARREEIMNFIRSAKP